MLIGDALHNSAPIDHVNGHTSPLLTGMLLALLSCDASEKVSVEDIEMMAHYAGTGKRTASSCAMHARVFDNSPVTQPDIYCKPLCFMMTYLAMTSSRSS